MTIILVFLVLIAFVELLLLVCLKCNIKVYIFIVLYRIAFQLLNIKLYFIWLLFLILVARLVYFVVLLSYFVLKVGFFILCFIFNWLGHFLL